jgi:hypothetical protein
VTGPQNKIFIKNQLTLMYSAWPRKSWPMMKRSLGPKIFFWYFRYFWKVCNKNQGYFCWKCKKVQNQPTLIGRMRNLLQRKTTLSILAASFSKIRQIRATSCTVHLDPPSLKNRIF